MKRMHILVIVAMVSLAWMPAHAAGLNATPQESATPQQGAAPQKSVAKGQAAARPPHPGFVRLAEVMPDVLLDVRYYSTYNFTADRVDGYAAPVAILSVEAANALKRAGETLRQQGYVLKIFDAYRPQIAVDHFVRWAADLKDTRNKAVFYPDVDKDKLFAQGYIARKSGHSRGSTVDLTLVNMKTGREVDMGSPFDFFGPISHHGTSLITPEQAANREILKKAMTTSGFKPYAEEWWHYTLKDEPYPDTYFNFTVE